MSQIDKKKAKLKERITALEFALSNTLAKKSVGKAISVPVFTAKILELKKEYMAMK